SRRRHTSWPRDWSSDVCSSDLQLLEFAQHDDFAVERLKFFNSAADPKARFRSVLFWAIRNRIALAQESGAKGSFAAMRAQNLEADGVEVGSEQGAGFVAGSSPNQGEKSFLCELFGICRIRNAATEEAEDRLFVTVKEFRKSLRRALREGQHEPLVAHTRPLRLRLCG